jgi:Transglycosylase SLT domain
MRCLRPAVLILLLGQFIATPATARARKTTHTVPPTAAGSSLDRVALAVDGAESDYGTNAAMWRGDAAGPQGPMQVTKAAASDVGGGDRFDTEQNLQIGRAYLAQLYHRYGDWPDAIAAYNWGIGNFDAWVKAGRPASGPVAGVSAYLGRVLHDSGLCDGKSAKRKPRAPAAPVDCADLAAWEAAQGDSLTPRGISTSRFQSQLDKALRLTEEHAGRRR